VTPGLDQPKNFARGYPVDTGTKVIANFGVVSAAAAANSEF
jgi:hypothetical protein